MQAANSVNLGKLAGLRLSAGSTAFVTFLLLWVILSAVAALPLQRPIGEAILLGLGAALLHWAGELWHQLGHAWAARRTGHPMLGIRFWGPLSSSQYPPDEPTLPKAVHIQRALGGPVASLLLGALLLIPLALLPTGHALWWLVFFFFLENFLVFGLGAFLPLGFNDGSTLLRLMGEKD